MAAGSIIQRLAIILRAKGVKMTSRQLAGLGAQTAATNASMMRLAGKAGGIAAVAGSLFAMVKIMQHATTVGKEFEQALANLKAISGATNNQLLGLDKRARELGMSTRYTASQVAFLQTEFARLGFTVEEIQNATKATLDLAAATDADLAQAALIAGQTVRAFGLDASETQRVTDTMAKSFTSSALTMDKFSDSMTYVGPVARSAGFSVEGTTATLGLLTNAGISGSIAGTSLRRIFLELSNESSRLTKRLGGPVKNAHDLAIRLNQLNKEGITTAEVKKLVGLRATSAFQILMRGAEDLEQLTLALEAAGGAAERMAEIQLDTLEGKLIILNSAWEVFGTNLYDYFKKPLQDGVESMTQFIQSLNVMIGIPIEQKMEDQRVRMDALFGAVTRTNLPTEKRKELIQELNHEFSDYLPKLISEKTSIDDIKKAREEANREFVKTIVLQTQQDRLTNIINENKDKYQAWGESILAVESAQTNLDNANQELDGNLSSLNEAFGSNNTMLEMYNIIMGKKNRIDEISNRQLNETQVRYQSVAGEGNEYINMSNEVRDIERMGTETRDQMLETMTKEENLFLSLVSDVKEYQQILADEILTEQEREAALEEVNKDLDIQQKIIDKITDSLNKKNAAGGGGLDEVESPGFFDDFMGFANVDFEDDFALIQSHGEQIADLMDGFAQHNIDRARQEAQAKIDILNDQMNEELRVLRSSHRYSKMSDDQKFAAEKKIKDQKQALIEEEEKAANEKIKREFKIQQAAKIASIAMNTAEAVMKAMAGSVFTAGMPWTALAVALGAAQTALVLKQQPPVMEQGGLVLGQSHAQGGTMIEAERGEFVMRRQAVEAIGIDTLMRMNEGLEERSININISGNVLTDTFIEEEAIPKIREAIRRGEYIE